jgi:hypothetical protein
LTQYKQASLTDKLASLDNTFFLNFTIQIDLLGSKANFYPLHYAFMVTVLNENKNINYDFLKTVINLVPSVYAFRSARCQH